MGIEAIPHKTGASRAKIVCDTCHRDEVVPCAYLGTADRNGEKNRPKESQARAKAISMGWSYIKNKLRCPQCEAKRKVVPMKPIEDKKPAEPTRAQKRAIMDMLEEVYDTDAERYAGGDTDDTVADVLSVMPGWVAQIREEFFGPDGGNSDMESLIAKLDQMEADAGNVKRDCAAVLESAKVAIGAAEKKLAEVSVMRADLEKIKKAVGPRNLKAAGVK